MADAPERIRVAQDADGFWTCREAVSGSQEYVRADLYAALEAQLAACTGAVKVKALDWSDHPAGGEQALGAGLGLYRVHSNGDDWYLVPDHMGMGGKAAAQADYERRILSALEPAPEAQQEPVAYRIHAPEDDYYGTGADRLQFHPLAQYDLDNGYRQTPLYTHPAQAREVTEAMELARAVLAQSITAGHNVPGPTPEDIEKAFWALDAALKAAMEAGR